MNQAGLALCFLTLNKRLIKCEIVSDVIWFCQRTNPKTSGYFSKPEAFVRTDRKKPQPRGAGWDADTFASSRKAF